jgi:hypothetical protein
MTYTFKLARRLAMSRDLSMVSALLLLAACAGDTTGPETTTTTNQRASDFAVRLIPRTVTIETNQKIRFRGEILRGRERTTTLAWSATGGTISDNGTFSATMAGTFKVVGRGRGRNQADTSTVIVVPTSPDVVGLSVSPDSVSLLAGATHTFTAVGLLSDGTTTPVGVTWTATGGVIDAGGVFTAGQTGGKYRIVATKTSSTLADTAVVPISVPEAPTLTSVVLTPTSASLSTGATMQFAAFGRNSAGDSVDVAVTFAATGGTVSSNGLYTAGSTGGTFHVVAAASGIADTAIVTLTQTLAAGGAMGLPFGAYALMKSTDPGPLTMSVVGTSSTTIVSQIADARTKGLRVILAMTSGPHTATNPGCCLSIINGVLQFDHAKWSAVMANYNTSTIRNAVASAVSDGTVIGANVMDEPNVCGSGDGNTWGPCGTMTKLRVDSLCGEVQQIFPTLPAGVAHGAGVLGFEPSKSYRVCQFVMGGARTKDGTNAQYVAGRDSALALGVRDHHAILFNMNVLDGGIPDTDGTYDCTGAGQGGLGTFGNHCRMTATQVHDRGLILGPYGCGLIMWRYDGTFWGRADNQQAFRDVAAKLATVPQKACRRS